MMSTSSATSAAAVQTAGQAFMGGAGSSFSAACGLALYTPPGARSIFLAPGGVQSAKPQAAVQMGSAGRSFRSLDVPVNENRERVIDRPRAAAHGDAHLRLPAGEVRGHLPGDLALEADL